MKTYFLVYVYTCLGMDLFGLTKAFTPPVSQIKTKIGTNPPTQGQRIPTTENTLGIDYRATTTTSTSLNTIGPTAITSVALPTVKTIIGTTLLPTCLGYYRYEYGVSYGYGTATATTAFLALRFLRAIDTTTTTFRTLAQIHALAIVFYGLRLNLFLLYRELFIERFRKMRERIEDRQRKKEDGRGWIGTMVNRTPFILSCALLYAGLASPPLAIAKLIEMGMTPTSCDLGLLLYKVLVGCTWFGFGLGAIGDLTKTFVKSRKGPDHLVTGGLFRVFRHPNYTGEMIGWTCSFLASLVGVLSIDCAKLLVVLKSIALQMGLGIMGTLGIIFVLCAATTGLEKKQKENYGDNEAYQDWISSSWAGPKFSPSEDKK